MLYFVADYVNYTDQIFQGNEQFPQCLSNFDIYLLLYNLDLAVFLYSVVL